MLNLFIHLIQFTALFFFPLLLFRLVMFRKHFHHDNFFMELTFLSIIFWTLVSLSVYNLNFDLTVLKPFNVYFSFLSIVILLIFIIKNFSSFYIKNFYTLIIGIALFFGILSLFFISDFMYYSMPQNVGPDASGYLISVNYLYEGGTKDNLVESLISQSGSSNLDYLFKPGNYALPKIESYNLRVTSEFLIGSVRQVFPAFIALITMISFHQDVTSIAVNFIVFFMISSFVLLYTIIYRFSKQKLISTLSAGLILLNPMNLNLYLEGGIAQIVCIYALLSIIYYFVCLTEFSVPKILLLITLIYCLVLFYPDLIFILPIFILPFILLYPNYFFSTLRNFSQLFNLNHTLLVLPLVFLTSFTLPDIGKWIFRRFGDASQGGWPQGHWPYLSDLLGITSPFIPTVVGTFPRTQLQTSLALLAFTFCFAIFLYCLNFAKVNSNILRIGLIPIYFLIFSIIYNFYLRDLKEFSNYQSLKVLGVFSPVIMLFSIIFVLLVFNKNFFTYTFSFFLLLNSINVFNYVKDFKSDGYLFIHGKTRMELDSVLKSTSLINTIPFGVGGLGIPNVSTWRPVYQFRVENNLENWYNQISANNVAFLISQDRCKNPGCIWLTNNSKHSLIGDDFLILYPEPNPANGVESTFFGYFVYWFNLKNYFFIPAENHPLFMLKS